MYSFAKLFYLYAIFLQIYYLISQLHATPFNVGGNFGLVITNAAIIKVSDSHFYIVKRVTYINNYIIFRLESFSSKKPPESFT